jgi:hypothetical protein
MVIMYKMTPEKKEKFTHKIEKMIDFLEEFRDCLEDSDYADEAEYRGGSYRGGSYRHHYDEDDMMSGRYGYSRGRM